MDAIYALLRKIETILEALAGTGIVGGVLVWRFASADRIRYAAKRMIKILILTLILIIILKYLSWPGI